MDTVSNSRRLRRQFEWVLPEVFAATSAVVTHPRFRELYPEFLIAAHQLVRATVPLMQTSLARCRALADADPVAAATVPYYEHHIREEMHHDDWVLEDLEFVGVPRAEVLRRAPSAAVASNIGAQYYWIHHHHPVAQLGHIAVQEGYPPTAEWIDLMAARSGYDRRAFRTLEKHGRLDPNHRDDFDEALDRLPLREEHHDILLASALHTIHSSARVYREVVERAADGATAPSARMPLRRSDLTARRTGGNGDFRVEDGLRGTAYRIGEQEQFLLAKCDGRTSAGQVRRAFAERFGQPLTEAEFDEFLRTAGEEQFVVTGGQDVTGAARDEARMGPDR